MYVCIYICISFLVNEKIIDLSDLSLLFQLIIHKMYCGSALPTFTVMMRLLTFVLCVPDP